MTTLSPYVLRILMHYYARADDHEDLAPNPAIWRESVDWLKAMNLMTPRFGGDNAYMLTERGEAFVQAILTTPLPVEVRKWVIPPREALAS